jgi:hypothetical protein
MLNPNGIAQGQTDPTWMPWILYSPSLKLKQIPFSLIGRGMSTRREKLGSPRSQTAEAGAL